jgi:mRNA-degrading endonuclease RelE of RelBE toxin-antitoxin system
MPCWMSYQIRPTYSFQQAAKRLARKYPHIKADLRCLHDLLADNPQQYGVAIPGFAHRIWKIRLRSTDMQSGKRGGYRVIYAINHQKRVCYLLFIYAKGHRSDVTPDEIERLLQDLERELSEQDNLGPI